MVKGLVENSGCSSQSGDKDDRGQGSGGRVDNASEANIFIVSTTYNLTKLFDESTSLSLPYSSKAMELFDRQPMSVTPYKVLRTLEGCCRVVEAALGERDAE